MAKKNSTHTKEAVLVYPHQLFKKHPAIVPGRLVYIIEEPLYFSQYKFHKQKLILHRASMKTYERFLLDKKYTVHYIEYARANKAQMERTLTRDGVSVVHVADVVDVWLAKKISQLATELSARLEWYETPQFITSDKDIREYWSSKKKHLQHTFYTWQRARLDVLMDNGKPLGGKWSYDVENRKSLPKGVKIPPSPSISKSPEVVEAIAYVEKHFADHYGSGEPFSYAVTHKDAHRLLKRFLVQRFTNFGAYEDAISMTSNTLFHSVVSPYVNTGLLTPHEILDAVLVYAKEHNTPLASVEGFVRQLIGWREFIRMVYVCDGTRMRNQNSLHASRSLTSAWWTGTTGVLPVDHAIKDLKNTAYSHHIVRLMVLGNIMTLLQITPKEAHRWFMEWYIDAYDWVMVPNVYGMALYADGGSMVTKPYVSSSRYLLTMSDYPKGEWCALWDALYWNFIDRHQDVLVRNVRTSFPVHMFRKFSSEKQEAYRGTARKALKTLTSK